ncbi:hypothetical protein [Paenibacillus larvae]|uniref:hypothetical protein n=1 Tax=Paenibacillus larvae TaxID=1464 RepID=UPI0028925BAD|nr:hypothetical protein [Paenibacillus larvae]MDT2191809.1 hypothetical protein [Paenibacillus larvae]
MKVPRSTYYYMKNKKVMKKTVSEGRSAPRIFYQANGTKVPDEQIQEWLMELISSDGLLMDTGS